MYPSEQQKHDTHTIVVQLRALYILMHDTEGPLGALSQAVCTIVSIPTILQHLVARKNPLQHSITTMSCKRACHAFFPRPSQFFHFCGIRHFPPKCLISGSDSSNSKGTAQPTTTIHHIWPHPRSPSAVLSGVPYFYCQSTDSTFHFHQFLANIPVKNWGETSTLSQQQDNEGRNGAYPQHSQEVIFDY